MILQALNRYYQILLKDQEPNVAPPGFSSVPIHFAIILSETGKLLGLTPLSVEEQRGKKVIERPIQLMVPQRVMRTGNKILSNFLWDNAAYVLGLSKKDDKRPNYAKVRFSSFKIFNLSLLQQADCRPSIAVYNFLSNYDPDVFQQTQTFHDNSDSLMNANFVFKLVNSDKYIHEDQVIRNVWKHYLNKNSDAPIGLCLVTGDKAEIVLTHHKIKGIPGGKPAGTAIVSFNERAYESFNRTNQQGLNAPIGKDAMFGYTSALNYLLQSQHQKIVLSGTTVVYWAESIDKTYVNLFSAILNPASVHSQEKSSGRDIKTEILLENIAHCIKNGMPLDDIDLYNDVDGTIRFYVLGLSPNAARASIRFFNNDPFKKTISNLLKHHRDMAIMNEYGEIDRFYSISQIIWETVTKKSKKQEPSPLLSGSVFRSVLMNLPYPAALYNAILLRIRSDQDNKEKGIKKINHLRAAIIKAFLIRKYRNQNKYQEELQMTLNKDSTNQAYLLGRLFAVMEKAQQDAAEKELNATIKDRYFTSACATPATTFPILLRLSQHHISKAKYGKTSDRRIQEIMQLLDVEESPFPKHLNLDEQGIFVLGYYHQRADFYHKKTDLETTSEEE